MNRARHALPPDHCGELIDFDELLLGACPAGERDHLLTEARLLAQAFEPDRSPDRLERIARSLSAGEHDGEMERARARKLAAALRHLGRQGLG